MKRSLTLLALAVIATAPSASAQQYADTMVVMTVPLKHINANDAVTLLKPYVLTQISGGQLGGAVSATPDGHAVTIREKVTNYGRMLMVLRDYDKAPPTLAFTFQLIIADKSGARATEIASLDSVLRSALKFTGYHLVGTTIMRAQEHTNGSVMISAENTPLALSMMLYDVRVGPDGFAQIRIDLAKSAVMSTVDEKGRQVQGHNPENLIATNVTIPIGQTVVLGSAAFDKDRAIILTVRPQILSNEGKTKDD